MIPKEMHNGEILTHLVEIVIRIENIKDIFDGDKDLSQVVNEVCNV